MFTRNNLASLKSVAFLIPLFLSAVLHAQDTIQQPADTPNVYQKAQIALKYGMFCHFSINTFLNMEWSDGTEPASKFAPTAVDCEQWVRSAYSAGMNYILCITKHHDGFCVWPTKKTEYCVRNATNKTDIVDALSKACKKYNMKLALYYSLWDRHEPLYRTNFDKGYIPWMKDQLTELFTNYGPISELWLDGGWDKSPSAWRAQELYAHVKRLQPGCQFSINVTIENSSVYPNQYQAGMKMQYFPSEFRLYDNYVPRADDPKLYAYNGKTYYLPFEATLRMNKSNWFYHTGDENTTPQMSVTKIVDYYNLLTKASNNMVFNCAPTRAGVLMDKEVANLVAAAKQLGIYRNPDSTTTVSSHSKGYASDNSFYVMVKKSAVEFRFNADKSTAGIIKIYNAAGKQIQSIHVATGTTKSCWYLDSKTGYKVLPGVYVAELKRDYKNTPAGCGIRVAVKMIL